MKRFVTTILAGILALSFAGCSNASDQWSEFSQQGNSSLQGNSSQQESTGSDQLPNTSSANVSDGSNASDIQQEVNMPEDFVLIKGGTFEMGSPETEAWRSDDETQHTVTVSDFYIGVYELTQAEYFEVTGENPSNFSGDNLPVENISWLDAVRYCNARSEKENLTTAYTIDGNTVTWDRSADGYRLPTEAEWEYACRAGTTTPFNTENPISAEEANYYGHYPYEIEGNYFTQENLTTKPGQYRQTTVTVDSFSPNKWGL